MSQFKFTYAQGGLTAPIAQPKARLTPVPEPLAPATPNMYKVDGEEILFLGNPRSDMTSKFDRTAKIASKYDDLIWSLSRVVGQHKSPPPTSKAYNLAVAMLLINKTGIRIGNESSAEGYNTIPRPGSDKPSKFVKTYGLTTMLVEHVSIREGIVHFNFVGKKQVHNTFILDKYLSDLVIPILVSNNTPAFGITEHELTKFVKSTTEPYLSAKDFRTFRANVFAYQKIRDMSVPKNKKSYKKKHKEVLEFVSNKLNNTPAVVKKSYLDPRLVTEVWGEEPETSK